MKICAYEAMRAFGMFAKTMSVEPGDLIDFLEEEFKIDLCYDLDHETTTLEDVMIKFVTEFVV